MSDSNNPFAWVVPEDMEAQIAKLNAQLQPVRVFTSQPQQSLEAVVQKLCVNCQHLDVTYEKWHNEDDGEQQSELTFRCGEGKFDLKNRPLGHAQFVMYMYMGQKCELFKILDFSVPQGRAGLPSGEQFGSGGLLQVDPPPPSQQSQSEVS